MQGMPMAVTFLAARTLLFIPPVPAEDVSSVAAASISSVNSRPEE